jgi:hypothetical protein
MPLAAFALKMTFQRWCNQVISLYWKNMLVAWRNRGATILRLFIAPMLFLLLALIIDKVS